MATNYYTVLGVAQNATTDQVRSRFLELAKQLHPDRFPGEAKAKAEEDFQQITEAFNVLSNPLRRREHDQDLAAPMVEQSGPDPDQLLKVYMQRGVKAYREKNFPSAADNFHRAAKTDPTNAKTWYHLGLACSHEVRWRQQALAAFDRACDLEPMNFRYTQAAGEFFEKAGKTEEAERYYSLALKWGGSDESIRAALERLRKTSKKGRSGFFGKAN